MDFRHFCICNVSNPDKKGLVYQTLLFNVRNSDKSVWISDTSVYVMSQIQTKRVWFIRHFCEMSEIQTKLLGFQTLLCNVRNPDKIARISEAFVLFCHQVQTKFSYFRHSYVMSEIQTRVWILDTV